MNTIQPIDLLYKSLNEVEKELGKRQGAKEKYQEYEKERQRKFQINIYNSAYKYVIADYKWF